MSGWNPGEIVGSSALRMISSCGTLIAVSASLSRFAPATLVPATVPMKTPYFLAVWFFILCVCQSASCSADSKSLAKSEASGSRNRETMITAAGSSFKSCTSCAFCVAVKRRGAICSSSLSRARCSDSASLPSSIIFSIVVFCPEGRSGHMAAPVCCLAKISVKTAAADCPRCNSS